MRHRGRAQHTDCRRDRDPPFAVPHLLTLHRIVLRFHFSLVGIVRGRAIEDSRIGEGFVVGCLLPLTASASSLEQDGVRDPCERCLPEAYGSAPPPRRPAW